MINSLFITFYPKKTTSNQNTKAVIYARLTYNSKRTDFTTSRKIDAAKWNSHTNSTRGNSTEAKALKRYLDDMRAAIYDIHDRLVREGKRVSAKIVKDIYMGKGEKQYMLVEIFQDHNDDMEKLIGKGYTKGTLQRYNACKKHIEDYIAFRFKTKDLPVEDVDHQFIVGFNHYLKSEKNCAHNTAQKYIVNFKKIIRIAYANQWIEKDPFFHWKGSWKTSERKYLTDIELQNLVEQEFEIPRLDRMRDIFVFCCYTGLSFSDVEKLSEDDIVTDIKGKQWIKTERQKTKSLSSVPLLDIPKALLEKYKDHPQVKIGKVVLPVNSNQKYNAYLKEIATICGIKKNLTTHLARHTFATTVTLSKGVPIESVSKMLGHRSLKTTQIYAKVLDEKIEKDMEKLQEQLRLLQEQKEGEAKRESRNEE
ncbi:site-specific integrase [Salegentibacter salegens]|uniref:Site-specific recombinase XerD n=1 Tax=Salegentibacter salegens TaxID=143223 RepID=A0A1M7LPA8_9FLAO|nr:site-specific integrase [Salegentibacter salegens]PRX52246.1 site-specific recombinase XerD [Salegentibacter salegens]SHM80086.1 Site-specific recombinase XerD [Salegentibacter salegens]